MEPEDRRRAGTVPRNVNTARKARHLVPGRDGQYNFVTALSRRWNTVTGVKQPSLTVIHRLLKPGLVAHMPFRRLSLSRNH